MNSIPAVPNSQFAPKLLTQTVLANAELAMLEIQSSCPSLQWNECTKKKKNHI